jgi:hypothetical protein
MELFPFRFRDPTVRVVIAAAMLGFCAGALSQQPSPARLDDSSSEWWLVYITGALATITFFLALYTARLWSATSRLVKDAKDTAQRQLRAYVCIKDPEAVEVRSADRSLIDNLKITPNWENAGNTPTQRMAGCTGWDCLDGELPVDFQFPNNRGGPHPAFAGPRTIITGHPVFIPLQIVRKVQRGEKRLYVWGWVDYDDVFAATPRHRTEFCWDVRIDQLVKGGFAIRGEFYGKHNGADDECIRKPSAYAPPP